MVRERFVALVILSLLAVAEAVLAQTEGLEPAAYLPAGAEIEDPSQDVVRADLDGDGSDEVVIFHTVPREGQNADSPQPMASISLLAGAAGSYRLLWSTEVQEAWGFWKPLSGVFDAIGDGRPQIYGYTRFGASCNGVLEVFRWTEGSIQRITGDWRDGGYCQNGLRIEDLDGDGRREIVYRIRNYGVNDRIYRWNGSAFVLASDQFPSHYASRLSRLTAELRAGRFSSPVHFIQMLGQAVEIHRMQKTYQAGIELADASVRLFSERDWVKENGPLATDYRRAKAEIHRLLAGLHGAAGDTGKAARHNGLAKRLRDGAPDI